MRRFFLILLLGSVASFASAQAPEISFEGPRILGADVGLTWGSTKLFLGAGWETLDVGRDLTSGSPRGASSPSVPLTFPDGLVKVRQSWIFEEFVFWTGPGLLFHGDLGLGGPTSGRLVDRRGGSFAFFQTGVTRDRRSVNSHGVVSGTFFEAFVEASPQALSSRSTDYTKVSFATSGFWPLWDLEGDRQLFSGTLALRGNAQWIDGASVPLLLLEPTEVRGYHRLLDTRFRSVATAELRLGLPSLWGPADLVPVVLLFGEGGWYSGYANAPQPVADKSGWLSSMGAGVGVAVFGSASPTLTVALPLSDGEASLWWKFNFTLRF